MNRTSTILTAATALALVSGARSTSMAQYRAKDTFSSASTTTRTPATATGMDGARPFRSGGNPRTAR